MRISDWSSDVCSSDLSAPLELQPGKGLLATGNSGTFAFVDWTGGAPMKVDYKIAVRGLGDFRLIPRGVDTRWTVKSTWPNPSFSSEERRAGKECVRTC